MTTSDTPQRVSEEELAEQSLIELTNEYGNGWPMGERIADEVRAYIQLLKADLAAAEEREKAAFEAGATGAWWNDYKNRKRDG